MKTSLRAGARNIRIIGMASGIGAPDPTCASGPEALRRHQIFHDMPSQHMEWASIKRAHPMSKKTPLQTISTLNRQLATDVETVLQTGDFPLVVGGDHSCAIGTWSGVHHALADRGPIGLIWIDAHMDSHTFATSPSGQIHGMPLACLLGHGETVLTTIGGPTAKLRPEHVCLIGVRSYETGEARLLHQLGVRIFDMDEVHQRGLNDVFDEALAIVRHGTAGFGVSVDLDALDPVDAPGVGSPVPNGLHRAELIEALSRLRSDPAFVAMEIAEYNPRRDRGHATADVVGALVDAITPQ